MFTTQSGRKVIKKKGYTKEEQNTLKKGTTMKNTKEW